jgi:hypothetical protein
VVVPVKVANWFRTTLTTPLLCRSSRKKALVRRNPCTVYEDCEVVTPAENVSVPRSKRFSAAPTLPLGGVAGFVGSMGLTTTVSWNSAEALMLDAEESTVPDCEDALAPTLPGDDDDDESLLPDGSGPQDLWKLTGASRSDPPPVVVQGPIVLSLLESPVAE